MNMKKTISLAIAGAAILFAMAAHAAPVTPPPGGGTGTPIPPQCGQVLIGNSSSTYTPGRIAAGSNMTVATGTVMSSSTCTITLSSSGGGGGSAATGTPNFIARYDNSGNLAPSSSAYQATSTGNISVGSTTDFGAALGVDGNLLITSPDGGINPEITYLDPSGNNVLGFRNSDGSAFQTGFGVFAPQVGAVSQFSLWDGTDNTNAQNLITFSINDVEANQADIIMQALGANPNPANFEILGGGGIPGSGANGGGYVGIGNLFGVTPSAMLDVHSSDTAVAAFNVSAFDGSGLTVGNTSGTPGYVGIGTSTPATRLAVVGTSTFTGGNVGIGTLSPSAPLSVVVASGTTAYVGNDDMNWPSAPGFGGNNPVFAVSKDVSTVGDNLFCEGTSAAGRQVCFADRTPTTFQYGLYAGNVSAGVLGANTIATNQTSANSIVMLDASTTMTLNSGNNIILKPTNYVGIGTASPSSTLHVVGGVTVTGSGTLSVGTAASTSAITASGTVYNYLSGLSNEGLLKSLGVSTNTLSLSVGDSNLNNGALWESLGSSTFALFNLFAKSRSANGSSSVAVILGDQIGGTAFLPDGGAGFAETAETGAIVDGAPGPTSTIPTALYFKTGTTGVNIKERMRISSVGNVGIGTSTPDSSLDVKGNVRFEASSTVVTPTIGGAIVSGGCDSATSSIDTSVTSSTASFVTTPQNDPGATLGGTWAYSFLSAPGTLTTRVCANVTVTPNSTPYVVKIIK